VEDQFGNIIDYYWRTTEPLDDSAMMYESPATYQIERIEYTKNATVDGGNHFAEVRFDYGSKVYCNGEQMAVGGLSDYHGGILRVEGELPLSDIRTFVADSPGESMREVRRVHLAYDPKMCQPSRSPSRQLLSIEETGFDKSGTPVHKNPIEFTYGPTARAYDLQTTFDVEGPASGSTAKPQSLTWGERDTGSALENTIESMLIDLDGDGRLDRIFSDYLSAYPGGVALNANTSGTAMNGCGMVWLRNEGDQFSKDSISPSSTSSVPVKLPRINWRHGAPMPDSNSERCSLTGQVTARRNATESVHSCGNDPSTQLVYQFMDVNSDGLPDLVTALYYDDNLYDPGPDESYPFTPGTVTVDDNSQPDTPPIDNIPAACTGGQVAPMENAAGKGFKLHWFQNEGPAAGFFDLTKPKSMDSPISLPPNVGSSRAHSAAGGARVSYSSSSFTDIDGDGNIDAIWSDGYNNTKEYSVGQVPSHDFPTTKWSVRLGDGSGGFHTPPGEIFPYPWPVPDAAQVSGELRAVNPTEKQGSSQSLTNLVDVNGDGLVDLVYWYSEYPNLVYQASYVDHGSSRIYLNDGTGFAHTGQWDEPLLTYDTTRPAVATSMSAFEDTGTVGSFLQGNGDSRLRLADFDSDGRPDLFSRQPINLWWETYVPPYDQPSVAPFIYVNPGLGTFTTPQATDSIVSAPGFLDHKISLTEFGWEVTHDFIDLSGDGEPEMVAPKNNDLDILNLANRDTAGQPLRLLNTVDNGNGGLTEITYAAQNDPSVAAASQADYAVMPRHIWVVKDVTVTDTTTGLTAVQEVKYGAPVWKQNDHGKWGFRGFTSIESSSAHEIGATTGFRVVVRNFGYEKDWSGRLEETRTFADGFAMSQLASIQRSSWEKYELFGGATKSFHSELAQSTVCDAEIDTLSCEANGLTTYSRSSYATLESVDTSDGIELAWAVDVTNTQQALAPIGASQTLGDLMATLDYELHSSSDKYWLLQTEANRSVVNDSMSWESTGRSIQEADATETYAEVGTEYFDATAFATSREVRDVDTGLIDQAVTPELETQSWGYSGFKVHATLHTDFGGNDSHFEIDLGTGQVTRSESPNTIHCGGDTGPEASLIEYDGFGRVVEQRVFACVASNDYDNYKTLEVEYSEQGLASPMQVRTKAYEDFAGAEFVEAESDMDGFGRVIESRVKIGNASYSTSKTEYGVNGQVARSSTPNPAHDDDALRIETSYRYDSLGRSLGVRVGNLTGAAPNPDGGDVQWNTHVGTNISYSIVGDYLVSTTAEHVLDSSPLSQTSTAHDFLGRLIFVDELLDDATSVATTSYGYDGNNNLNAIQDADGVVTTMLHDWVGRRTNIYRGAREWKYQYDNNGRLTLETAPVPSGQSELNYQTSYVYDSHGRPFSKLPAVRDLSAADALLLGADTATQWNYDTGAHNAIGRLVSVSGPFFERTLDYDSLGGVRSETFSYEVPSSVGMQGVVRDYMTQEVERDAAGRVKRLYAADGTSLSYVFDDAGREQRLLWGASSGTVIVADLTRNVAGRVIGRDSDNAHRTWTYDRLGRVTETEVHKNSNKWRFEESMQYFDNNEVSSQTVRRRGLSDRVFTYDYDSRHQLLGASDGSYASVFTYTNGGKVDTASVDPLALAPQVFGRDVDHNYGAHTGATAVDGHAVETLTNSSDNSIFAAYSYDKSGNVIQRDEYMSGSLVQRDFTYDGDDQMRRAKLDGGNEELYYYDENGQRFLSVEVGTKSVVRTRAWFGSTEFWYADSGNGSDPAVEVPGTSFEKVMTRLTLGGLAVARIDNEQGQEKLEYSFHNGLGHLMGALDDDADVSTAFVYGPFGEIIDELGETATHLRRFNGKDADPLSRLNYYGYRYYDPLSLQWTQADPLFRRVPDLAGANPRDMNLYTFSLNNPVRYVDPDGLQVSGEGWDCPDCQGNETITIYGGGGPTATMSEVDGWFQGAYGLSNAAQRSAGAVWYSGGASNKKKIQRGYGWQWDRHKELADNMNIGGQILGFVYCDSLSSCGSMVAFGVAGKLLGKGLGVAARSEKARALATKVASLFKKCFAAGTLVETASGLRSIEEIAVGDLVWSRDDETGEEGWKPVVQLFVTPDKLLLDLDLRDADGHEQELLVTSEHPLRTANGWTSVGDLEIGEAVWAREGWAHVVSVASSGRVETVYNFEVEGFHSYFVGEAGVWAHNRCLQAGDLGLSGKGIKALSGEVIEAGSTRIISVDNILATKGSLVGELRGALPKILDSARGAGVKTLQVEASFANDRLRGLVGRQVHKLGGSFSSVGGKETATFILP
tara:strand:+ start:17603 stop:24475 length:6873 start_codon:yes stop_codon:yes gene_type:complete